MSYAVRNDGLGWRAVTDAADVMEGEYFSEVQPEAVVAKITASALKEAITQKRWEVETGGITLADGTFVLSGIDDQNRMFNALKGYDIGPVERVRFKGAGGVFAWIEIDLLRAIGKALSVHTAKCFEAEGDHYDAIDSLVAQHEGDAEGLQAALEGYDIEQGWPATDLREPQPA